MKFMRSERKRGGEFSTGILGKFHPALTPSRPPPLKPAQSHISDGYEPMA